jgi:hypothetical protein
MKRGPRGYERALVHQTLNSAQRERIALCRENFDAAVLSRLHQSLPSVPWTAGWEVDRGELLPFLDPKCDDPIRGPEQKFEFRVKIRGRVASRNHVVTDGGTIYLVTTLLAAGRKLCPEDGRLLEELEQYMAIVTLEWPEWL